MFSLTDYDYTLPESLIAQHPTLPPENARLLVYDTITDTREDQHFYDLPSLLTPGTLMVFNDSKVVKARILFPDIWWELLFLRLIDTYTCEALVRPGKKRKEWATHTIPGTAISCSVQSSTHDWRILTCSEPILDVLEQHGQMPLPPYITYDPNDAEHYQPTVADHNKPWSVAAPTAALHFSSNLLQQLDEAHIERTSVTLHVWIGTFKTVDVENIKEYAIHDEVAEVSKDLFSRLAAQAMKQQPILAIGTTTTRTLESLPYVRVQLSSEQKTALRDETTRTFRDNLTSWISLRHAQKYVSQIIFHSSCFTFHCALYIYPWFQFRIIDQLVTNFHLPKSSLLMLVAWFIWYEHMKAIYAHGIKHHYRFFSFWDGMLLKRKSYFVK